jgi:hypothetical protein
MAEVTGDIGGQPVQLNNAATEATLRQLLNSMTLIAQKLGVDAKRQAEMEKEMNKFFNQLDKTNKAAKNAEKLKQTESEALNRANAQRQREQELALKSEKAAMAVADGLGMVANASMEYANKLTSVMSSFANMGNSFSGAASVFSNIPIVGGMLGNVFGAIASAADKLQKSFIQAGSVGATFGGSIREMVNHASMAGLTFEQYSQVIQKNGESLALLGGSTSEGAKRLSQLSKTLKQSGLQDDLARLGMSAEDIASGMAQVTGRLSKAGLTRGMSDTQLAKTSADYLKNLDAISRLTGKNKDALQAEADARMADSKYRLMLAKLDPEGAANLEQLMASIPKEHQAGLREIAATGNAVSDAAQAALYYTTKTGQNAMNLNKTMLQTGTLTKEQVYAFDEARRAEAKTMAEQGKLGKGVISTLGMFGDDLQQQMTVGILDTAAQRETLRTTTQQQTAELKAATEAQKKNKDSLDPANMLRLQQEIAKTANEFNVLLAEYLPKLQEAFTILADFVKTYLVPVFRFFMDHLKEIALAIAGVVIGLGILKKTFEAFKAYQEFKNLGKERGSTPANPMFVKDISGGGGGGGADETPEQRRKRRESKRDKLKSVKTGGKLLKGVAGLGTVVSAGMLYSDLSDIDEREKAGEITAQQAAMEKGGSYGEAGGGLSGALGGAAAGAAIGSVVPVVGTVIGGLIGGALGGWLGSNLGETIGKSVAKPTATVDWMKINGPNIKAWADAVTKGSYKFEQVPDIYKGHVQDLLDKKSKANTVPATPVVAVPKPAEVKPTPAVTPTSAATEVKPPAGSGINYSSSPETLLKQFAQAQNPKNITSATPVIPMAATAVGDTVRKQLEADAEKKKQEDIAAENKAAVAAKEKEDKDKKTQEYPLSLLAELNTKMAQMIKLQSQTSSNTYENVLATKGLNNNLFKV